MSTDYRDEKRFRETHKVKLRRDPLMDAEQWESMFDHHPDGTRLTDADYEPFLGRLVPYEEEDEFDLPPIRKLPPEKRNH